MQTILPFAKCHCHNKQEARRPVHPRCHLHGGGLRALPRPQDHTQHCGALHGRQRVPPMHGEYVDSDSVIGSEQNRSITIDPSTN